MAKTPKQPKYVCNNCGAFTSAWSGRCSECNQWGTVELRSSVTGAERNVLKPEDLSRSLNVKEDRLLTGIKSVDEVLGGGVVTGSVCLISGEPGIGKSTLLMQLAAGAAAAVDVLYVSGEESLHQVGLRAKRLKVNEQRLKFAASTSADDIASTIVGGSYKLVIIDSVQSVRTEAVGSAAGSIAQVTNSATLLTMSAKQSGTAIIIVGHITKEGNVAGPKLLEHIVDVVLSLEGEAAAGMKMLKSTKNRFGSVNETAIFEMKGEGLAPVNNPSAILLAERKITDGSIVLAAMEGSRSILVEIQALVNKTAYGYPKRAASGFDLSRLNLLIAVIENRTSLKLADKDVYLNIVGGLKISEPAADLAVVMAISSAAKVRRLKDNAVVFGEVGLSGEVRHVPFIDRRLKEMGALGFDYAIGPRLTQEQSKSDLQFRSVSDIKSALNLFLKA